ncbi:SNF related kinase [Arctopsyche grandis]|uniref:SNF related kinase n=1 Tax=Arctopsyche grandis TaxID=121162 RepID=UPI00406D817C
MHRNVAIGGPGLPGPGNGGKIAGLYDLEETLGSGHFAVVKLARHVFTGEKVAVKVIDKTKLDEVSRAHLFQEVRCMKLVQHPNVVRLYEVIDTQTKLYLILELGDGGDLYDYIMKHESGLSEKLAREYFKQIVRAISYCHRLHVVHRDLKPENVVFFEKLGIVKLTDFGFSNKFCPGQKLETSCGSLAYSAPEILLGDSYDAPAVDIWSLGVILYMLVCGHAPFQEANDSETLTMIMDCKYTTPHHVSSECKKLISRMLVREPDKRATLAQISADPWLLQGNQNSAETFIEESIPLVSHQHLSEDDHALIVQKMVNGHIASKEQILEALEKNEYNHMTATYYLLAERKLRAHRQKENALKRPEILGVNLADRSNGTDTKNINPVAHRLSVPNQPNTSILLTIPRTPGDAPQRARKCSIVREEEDDEEGTATRRGSRSEGRLHLALQDRIPLALAAPPVPAVPPVDIHSKLASAVSKVNLEDENTRKHLGNAGMGTTTGWISFGKKTSGFGDQSRPKSAIEQTISVNNNFTPTLSIPKIVKTPPNIKPENAIRSPLPLLCEDETSVVTTTISEAATITIPIRGNTSQRNENTIQTYKTMPLNSRPSKHILDDGTWKSPKPVRGSETVVKDSSYQQRRTKCHKNYRTASCSSSDASDDDSEGRKKRPPKHMNTPTHKPIPQRRDSHDDSSDSQEHGATGSGGNGSSNHVAYSTTNSSGSGSKQSGESGNSGGSSLTRRHRGGRRACETRLRESQSLNRITEVQEADAAQPPPQRSKGFFHPTRFLHGFGKRPISISSSSQTTNSVAPDPTSDKSTAQNVIHPTFRSQVHAVSEEKENCHKIVTVTEKHGFKKAYGVVQVGYTKRNRVEV